MSIRRRSEYVLALALAAGAASPRTARADEAEATAADPLDALRERFRAGMEKYAAGAYAEAIVEWESIYRDLGPEKGYRLAFNLGRAYDAYGDPTRAAEHYEIYVRQVAARRERGEEIDAQVEKQDEQAKERLNELAATRGRIRVAAGATPTAARVDGGEVRLAGFVVYVAPGRHVVTFGTGASAQRREVVVREGEIVELAPPAPEPAPLPSPRPPPEPRYELRTERPFPAAVWIGFGAATLASVIVPVVTYSNASAIRDEYDSLPASERTRKQELAADYQSARSTAYATLAVPATFAALTGALFAWWTFGKSERRVPLEPRLTVGAGGGQVGVAGRF